MKKTLCALGTVLGLCLLIQFALSIATAQVPQKARLSKGFSYLFYRTTAQGKVPQALCTGDDAKSIGNGEILVTQFNLKKFHDLEGKDVQFIAQAPECRLDTSTGLAHSDGPLQIFSPSTNFFIHGKGFFCTQSNSLLVISNEVETRVFRALMKSPALPTNAPANSNDLLRIFGDHFEYRFDSNIVAYTGHVRAVDPQMELHCDTLTAHFNTNGGIENILAEHNVEIVTTNQGRATSDRATYVVLNGTEQIEMTGNAQWHDPQSDIQAEAFFVDRQDKTIRAERKARMTVQRNTLSMPQFPGSKTNASTTNAVVQITAGFLRIAQPTANHPTRSLSARDNVVIVSAADQSRATANSANFDESRAMIELSGNAHWQNEQFIAQAETLTLNTSNAVLSARHAASLTMTPGNKKPGTEPAEIVCENFELSTNAAAFHSGANSTDIVRMEFSEHGIASHLRCKELNCTLADNQLVTAVAAGDVHLEQVNSRTVSCRTLTLERSPGTGLWRRVRAEEEVTFQELAENPKTKADTNVRVFAGFLDAHFAANTNAIEEMLVERNVRIEAGELEATGQRAYYKVTGEHENLELTGGPQATFSQPGNKGKVKAYQLSAPEKITWDATAGTLFHNPTNGVVRAPGGKIIPLN